MKTKELIKQVNKLIQSVESSQKEVTDMLEVITALLSYGMTEPDDFFPPGTRYLYTINRVDDDANGLFD